MSTKITHVLAATTLTLFASASWAQANKVPGQDQCEDMEQSRVAAIEQHRAQIDKDPFFDEVAQQREADQDCMLDLSKELGGVVGADTMGFGQIVDNIFKRVNDQVCDIVGAGGVAQNGQQMQTPTYTQAQAPQPQYVPPAPPPQYVPPAPPPVVPQNKNRTDDVWQRLSDAMAGITRD